MPEALSEALSDEGRLVPLGDTELFTVTVGAGTPTLVMHGGLGLDHTYLRPWLDDLGSVAELTYYDHRANGRSAPCDLAALGHETWVADAERLRRHLGHDRVVVLGHSYGGFLALEYALHHPDSVAGLVLVSTAAVMTHWEQIHANIDARNASQEQRRGFTGEPWASDEDFGNWLAAALPLYFHRPRADVMAAMAADMRISAAVSTVSGACMATFDVRSQLSQIDVPCLVVAGRHDFIMPVECTSGPLADGLPNAQLLVFEESGHFPFIEEHASFITGAKTWFERLTLQS